MKLTRAQEARHISRMRSFVVEAVLQAAVFSLGQMTVGRFIIGLGVGSAAMIIPLYSKTKYGPEQPLMDRWNVGMGSKHRLGRISREMLPHMDLVS